MNAGKAIAVGLLGLVVLAVLVSLFGGPPENDTPPEDMSKEDFIEYVSDQCTDPWNGENELLIKKAQFHLSKPDGEMPIANTEELFDIDKDGKKEVYMGIQLYHSGFKKATIEGFIEVDCSIADWRIRHHWSVE